MSIPSPTDMEYVQGYLSYLLTGTKTDTEDYTYGERLVDAKARVRNGDLVKEMPLEVNQIEEVIRMYKTQGFGTNQATMEIGMPSDIKLEDPPCLRIIDTRIRYGKLHFILYFRSWDLWGGFPSNLGGLQLVKQYMASEIGVEDGEIIACSKGLHLYEYSWELAQMRTKKVIKTNPTKSNPFVTSSRSCLYDKRSLYLWVRLPTQDEICHRVASSYA